MPDEESELGPSSAAIEQKPRPKIRNGGLTLKQARFVAEYLADLNATQAAIRAGYSKNCATSIGHENLTKPYVAKALQSAMDDRAAAMGLSQEFVIAGLLREIRAGDPDEPSPARIKALELLGKHLVMFTERIEIKGEVAVKPDMAELSMEDLSQLRELASVKVLTDGKQQH